MGSCPVTCEFASPCLMLGIALAHGLIADFKLSVTVCMHCRRTVIGNLKKFNMACPEAAAWQEAPKTAVFKRRSWVMAPRIKKRTDKQASRPAAGFPNFFRAHIVYPRVSVLLCAVCNLRDKCSSCLLLCCRLQASPATASMCACHLCELRDSCLCLSVTYCVPAGDRTPGNREALRREEAPMVVCVATLPRPC